MEVDGRIIALQLWDTAGQERSVLRFIHMKHWCIESKSNQIFLLKKHHIQMQQVVKAVDEQDQQDSKEHLQWPYNDKLRANTKY